MIEGTYSDSPFAMYPMLQLARGDLTSKVAVRTGLGLYPTVGNHFVITAPEMFEALEVAAEHGWFMAHFPLRTVGQVRSKVINGGRAYQGTKGLEHHGVHWKARYDLYLTHGDNVVKDMLQQWIDEVKQSRLA